MASSNSTNLLTFPLSPTELLNSHFPQFHTDSHYDNFYVNANGLMSFMDSAKMGDFVEKNRNSGLLYDLNSTSVFFGDKHDLNKSVVEFQGVSGSATVTKLGESSKVANQKSIVAMDSDASKKITVHSAGHRTSAYRGVTRHRWTGRFEAHLWDNSCKREGQKRKGRQGGYDKEEKAARAYDLAALKYWGPTANINFPVSHYAKELEEMKDVGKQEFVASLRRTSTGFSRGASKYRGVTRHHQQDRWQARIGRVAGNKDLYLGTYETEVEAAEAYDLAAIKFRGANAVTNFEISRYNTEDMLDSSPPVGGEAKRLKPSEESKKKAPVTSTSEQPDSTNMNSSIDFLPIASEPYDSATQYFVSNHLHHFHPSINAESGTAESAATTTNGAAEFFLWPRQSQ
ncbi:AP2-like ethylene-responsive transcription factor [Medicago truncatula]|uniref:AP2-like ethylene-responsive transcription factor n=1 Tax=Medicago truncatula TaxID=3880 RepID=A0A072U2R9_MEDTR|nr:AP2-like ethylene-responsive transcription factor [Medicago truncatula]